MKIKPLLEELSAAERLGMGEPKAIVHGNTRLPLQGGLADSEGSVPPSPSSSNIAAAISGTPCAPFSLLDSLAKAYAAAQTPVAIR